MQNRNYLLTIVLILAELIIIKSTQAQVYGCKDPLANNYNSAATHNDGSCLYTQTVYLPPVKVDPLNAILEETSGLQWAAGSLWTFNDGGGAAAIYKIDTITNTILQTVNLAGATNVDWEDIAFDGAYFYIGDFGNNLNGGRTDLKIYKFPISSIPGHEANALVTIPQNHIEIINFTWADQPQPPVSVAANTTAYDCEAMIADNNNIHLFSKNWQNNTTTHYVINSTAAGSYVATPLETLNTGYLVTGADKAIAEEVIVLLGYQNSGAGAHYLHILSDYNNGLFFNGNKRKIDLPNALTMGQAEGITFRNGGYGYISNEKFTRTIGSINISIPQRLRSFNTSTFVSDYILPVELKQFSINAANGLHQLQWMFNEKIAKLELQHSSDAINFQSINTYHNSISEKYMFQPKYGHNYYRLAWQGIEGAKKYSHVVARRYHYQSINNISVNANGEMIFTNNNNPSTTWAFQLLSPDGKLIAGIPSRTYNQGQNTVLFSHQVKVSGIVCIVATNPYENFSKMVWVQ